MATLTANQALNMLENPSWNGTISDSSSTQVSLTDGKSHSGRYFGTGFAYDVTTLTLSGTATGYTAYSDAGWGNVAWSVTGVSIPAATASSYLIKGTIVAEVLAGNDTITGSASADTLSGFSGNDVITGGAGNDVISGGAGTDIAAYSGVSTDYRLSYKAGVITVQDIAPTKSGNDGTDTLTQIETMRFSDMNIGLVDGLQYIASYADLRGALGANADAGVSHYIQAGVHEGRTATFDALKYTASYADLIVAFGTDTVASTTHYILGGAKEGRVASFDALKYTASYADLINAFGMNVSTATTHYILAGAKEGRVASFDGLKYIASYGDLINAFGTNIEAATAHYIQGGFKEGRVASFDANYYLAKYGDLRSVFGTNITAAETHYIQAGFKEGRTANVSGSDVLTGTSGIDVINGYAGNDTLVGLAGNDTLTGDLGADTFSFAANQGADIITDFNFAQGDYIKISLGTNSITTAALALSATTTVGGNAVINLGGSNSVTLVGVTAASLTTSAFVIG